METDSVIGELLNQFKDSIDILIYSDHGFEKGVLDFHVQTFLLNNNFMNLKKASPDYLPNGSWFEIEREDGLYVVDWENTVAYMSAPGSYGININLKGRQVNGLVTASEYNDVCDKLISSLSEIKNPIDNTFLFKTVCKREDVYTGNCLNSAPDIILIPEYYGIMVHHKLNDNNIFSMYPEQKGMHSTEGIVMLYGNRAETIEKIPGSIEEVAGAILAFYDIDAPEYMKGNSHAHNATAFPSSLKESYSETEKDSIRERLRNLGYY